MTAMANAADAVYVFQGNSALPTVFAVGRERVTVRQWFGLPALPDGALPPFRMSAWFDVHTSLGRLHTQNCVLDTVVIGDDAILLNLPTNATNGANATDGTNGEKETKGANGGLKGLNMIWSLYEGSLRYESRLVFDPALDVWSRRDRLANVGAAAVDVYRALPQFLFAPGQYETYVQTGRWCYENDGGWEPLRYLHLECEGGRTTQGAAPFLALRGRENRDGIAFHLVPNGNWELIAKLPSPGVGIPDNRSWHVLQFGHSSNKLRLALAPGEVWELPELLVQGVPEGRLERSAPLLHRYWAGRSHGLREIGHAVVYNPWFDLYAGLSDSGRLRAHLAAARRLGCEVFVIDAGWYGAGEGDWWQQAGDWRERVNGAFRGEMRRFADEVRAAGLGFGLWMEPERVCENAPIFAERPEWFAWGNGSYRPRLEEPEPYAWLLGEIVRLIETYGLVWLKLDFNFELGEDEFGTNFHAYYTAWYRMLDELKRKHPQVCLEGCASGGQRTDLHTIGRFDGHFLSDNVNPWDSLTAYQQGALRLPPHRLLKWLVVQPGGGAAQYGAETYTRVPTVVAPAPPGAGFENAETVDLDFACLVAMAGPFAVSGNFADLAADQLGRVAEHIAFYKKWRSLFKNCRLALSREPGKLGDRSGWRAMQFLHASENASLLYVYRLDDVAERMNVRLKELNRDRMYEITGSGTIRRIGGAELADQGMEVELAARHRAVVYAIVAVRS